MPKHLALRTLFAAVFVLASTALAAPPELVSPTGAVELRCPTFSWSAVAGAAGYELRVYGVSAQGDVAREPMLSVRLPGGAASWTPPGAGCLAAGGRYAWTLRVLGGADEGGWSEAALFEVVETPSLGEVAAAIVTLRRDLEEARRAETPPEKGGTAKQPASGMLQAWQLGASRNREAELRSLTAASVPSLGTPSLTVDANVALGAASNLFKAGSVFLWDDTTGNLGLGRLALASATGYADRNTAVGREALRYTVQGAPGNPNHGSYNTAVGDFSLRANTTGFRNTASGVYALLSNTTGRLNTAAGYRALDSNTSGSYNTASGDRALHLNTTGFRNTATGAVALYRTTGQRNTGVGYGAGVLATSGDDNIFLGSGAYGYIGATHSIRIGGSTGTGVGQQNSAFIAGIRGITTGINDAIGVLIDSGGQLGTASSSREAKQDIREIGELSERLLALRPVAFRYRQHVAVNPETPVQFGLIAEEVAEVFPELVVRDAQGRPETVKYHLLASLLLNELQRERQTNEWQQAELAALRDRVGVLERGGATDRASRWWRRMGGRSRDAP